MSTLPIILTVLCGLVTLIWLSRHIMIAVERRTGFILTGEYKGKSPARPFISVVVAAKDEEANIAACVQSMLQQDYADFEIIVANDRSTDRTAQIVADIAATDARVRLVNIDHLPAGWGGKNHAMQHAIAKARGPWICMIDADCIQTSPNVLSAAIAYAQDQKSDLLSVLPILEMNGFWENAIQPVCSGLMMIWFHPDKVNSPRRKNAYANGAFMLMRHETYEAIGKHAAVRNQVNEDMHMAARVKSSGLNLRVVRNEGLYTVRMYTSLKQIYRGWSRIFYGTFGTYKRIIVSIVVLLIVSMLPYFATAAGLALWAFGATPAKWWLACGLAGAAAMVMQLSVIFRFYKLIHARAEFFWSYFIGGFVAGVALVTALGKLRKGAKLVWRNTSYDTNSLKASSAAGANQGVKEGAGVGLEVQRVGSVKSQDSGPSAR